MCLLLALLVVWEQVIIAHARVDMVCKQLVGNPLAAPADRPRRRTKFPANASTFLAVSAPVRIRLTL